MADHFARIHGTEQDQKNCPFFFKVGACRHGDKCSRTHHHPPFSQTILIKQMYYNPMIPIVNAGGNILNLDKSMMQQSIDDFYEEIIEEFIKFGELEDVVVCENLGDHMIGSVYAKYEDEEHAEKALNALNGRFFAGRQLSVEYSNVSNFSEARCRMYDDRRSHCDKGPFCNFMHSLQPSRALKDHCYKTFDYRVKNNKGSASMSGFR